MRLVCFYTLAAAALVAESAFLQLETSVRARSPDGFHDRNPQVPDVADQSYETTVKCNQERDVLAKELDHLLMAREAIDSQCEADLANQRELRRLAAKQVERLRALVAERKDQSELPPMYKAKYTAIMCVKLRNGFMMNDRACHTEVKHICSGNISLTDLELSHHDSLGFLKSLRGQLTVLVRGSDDAQREIRISPECFQAKAVQDQVKAVKQASAKKLQDCSAKQKGLIEETEKLRQIENGLWTEYNGHVSQREPIKQKAAKEVQEEFCSAVKASKDVDCNAKAKRKIEAFYTARCLPGAAPKLPQP